MTLKAPCVSWNEAAKAKLISPETLPRFCEQIRLEGKSIVTLNGSFDLLHAGHLEIIYAASQQADVLIVALNSDSSIKAYKSPDRPIIELKDRALMMSALKFVDYVTWFDETDPINILKTIKPNVHTNGAEYGTDCIEAETVKSFGGNVIAIDLVPGLSTSNIITKIRRLCD